MSVKVKGQTRMDLNRLTTATRLLGPRCDAGMMTFFWGNNELIRARHCTLRTKAIKKNEDGLYQTCPSPPTEIRTRYGAGKIVECGQII